MKRTTLEIIIGSILLAIAIIVANHFHEDQTTMSDKLSVVISQNREILDKLNQPLVLDNK